MSKSVLYASNNSVQNISVTTPTVINFGQIVRRYGCKTNLSGGNAVIEGCGYYDVDVNVIFTSTAAGTVTIQLLKDGVVIPGAISSVSIVADDIESLTIPTMIRETCDCESTITAVISGTTGNITSASVRVEKL